MAESAKIRVVVYKNAKTPQDGQSILIMPSWNKAQVLKLCSEALEIAGKKIFSENGHELESFNKLTEGAVLYVSQGESFQVIASSQRQTKSFVICMLGAAAVGKSAVTQRYVQNKFVRDYDPTIEDYYKKVSNVDNELTSLSILDTAGMEDYYPLIDDWIDNKDGFVLVYSVEWPDSLTRLESFNEKILHRYSQMGNKGPVVVIAANKIDSPNRSVSLEEGRKFAENVNAKHFEVSAATGAGIEEVYNTIIRELKSRRAVTQTVVKKHWYDKCSLL
jgi:GTPase KRas